MDTTDRKRSRYNNNLDYFNFYYFNTNFSSTIQVLFLLLLLSSASLFPISVSLYRYLFHVNPALFHLQSKGLDERIAESRSRSDGLLENARTSLDDAETLAGPELSATKARVTNVIAANQDSARGLDDMYK
jgi:hypothetical protein